MRRDRRGNVLMIFGLSLPPLLFATGMGLDYGSAMQLQTRLNAAADAAALSATSAAMLDQPIIDAKAQAFAVFTAQATGSAGLVPMNYLDPNQLNIVVNDTQSSANGTVRTSTVTYRGESTNVFSSILGQRTLTISGTSTATASTPPNIDFYVLLDASSSMALPTTTAGINFLKSKTVRNDYISNPNGCAFACHQSNPDNPKVRNAQGQYMDYYDLAHLNGIELRIDAGKHAISDMLTEAEAESKENGATYRFSVSTFDRATNFKNIAPLTPNYGTARAQTATAETVAVAMHANLYDRQTEPSGSIKKGSGLITAVGQGTRASGDNPQAVMFIITDGMRDEETGGRQMGPIPVDECTNIKARGIRIAVLYTTYQIESVNYDWWSNTYVVPNLWKLSPALQACASPGLFFEVSTDGSISDALSALFRKTVISSRLTR
jgi:Flp pilus assembly protein TadG